MSTDITQNFSRRHIGPKPEDQNQMLSEMGFKSIDELISQTLPESIRTGSGLNIGDGLNEVDCISFTLEDSYEDSLSSSEDI